MYNAEKRFHQNITVCLIMALHRSKCCWTQNFLFRWDKSSINIDLYVNLFLDNILIFVVLARNVRHVTYRQTILFDKVQRQPILHSSFTDIYSQIQKPLNKKATNHYYNFFMLAINKLQQSLSTHLYGIITISWMLPANTMYCSTCGSSVTHEQTSGCKQGGNVLLY